MDTYFRAKELTAQLKQALPDSDKALDREIRLRNARVREGNFLLKVAALDTIEPIHGQILRAKAVEVVAGERLLPFPAVAEESFTATEIAGMYRISSANMVGKIANQLGIKPPEGERNEYGYWIHSKSQHADKDVKSFMYLRKGAEAVRAAWMRRSA